VNTGQNSSGQQNGCVCVLAHSCCLA